MLRNKAKLSQICFEDALFAWRASPRADGTSPAFLLLGYSFRQPGLVELPRSLSNPLTEQRESRKLDAYNKRGGKAMRPAQLGDPVRVLDVRSNKWNLTGNIIKIQPSGASYEVQLPDGQVIVRGRRFLKLNSP